MAITFPVTGVTNTFSATTSPTFTFATGPVTDDIIVAFIASTTTATCNDISGWTNVLGVETDVESDAHQSFMMYHRVTAGETGTTVWTLTAIYDATETGRVSTAVLRGVATTGELVGSGSTFDSANTATPWVIATVTPTGNNCQIMAGVSGDGTSTQSTPGTHTLQSGAGTTQSCYLYSDNDLGQSGVATGTTNVTPSAGDEYVSIVACFAPFIPAIINRTMVGQAVMRAAVI